MTIQSSDSDAEMKPERIKLRGARHSIRARTAGAYPAVACAAVDGLVAGDVFPDMPPLFKSVATGPANGTKVCLFAVICT